MMASLCISFFFGMCPASCYCCYFVVLACPYCYVDYVLLWFLVNCCSYRVALCSIVFLRCVDFYPFIVVLAVACLSGGVVDCCFVLVVCSEWPVCVSDFQLVGLLFALLFVLLLCE